jgi:hypothetical protein
MGCTTRYFFQHARSPINMNDTLHAHLRGLGFTSLCNSLYLKINSKKDFGILPDPDVRGSPCEKKNEA